MVASTPRKATTANISEESSNHDAKLLVANSASEPVDGGDVITDDTFFEATVRHDFEDDESSEADADQDLCDESDDVYTCEALRTASEWKLAISSRECAEELHEELETMRPFRRSSKGGGISTSENFNNLVEGFVAFLDSGHRVAPKAMRSLTSDIFGAADLFIPVSSLLCKRMKMFRCGDESFWNVFNYLKSLPSPKQERLPRCFKTKVTILRSGKRGRQVLLRAYQNVWLTLMKIELPSKLIIALLPFVTDHVLDNLVEPHFTSDFFFKVFERGDIYSILSLGAIFKLIVHHNFEYPDFYDAVYALTLPSVCYMGQKEKFFKLLDSFLSSTHLPSYVVAGFAKRLSRLLIWAPFDAQEPLLALIKNLQIRHPAISILLHREVPVSIKDDPYDERSKLKECRASDSSLWEVKAMQEHWYTDVSKRAQYADKPLPKIESFVRYRCVEEYFSQLMGRKYGVELASRKAQFGRSQSGEVSDDEGAVVDKPNIKGKNWKKPKGKRRKTDSAMIDTSISTNFNPPDGNIFSKTTLLNDFDKFWSV